MRIETLYVTLVHFLLFGGVYGTLCHQAVATSYSAADSALHRHVCFDPVVARRTFCGAVQSPSDSSWQRSLESPFWSGSATLYSVFQVAWTGPYWRLRFFVCDEPASINCHRCPFSQHARAVRSGPASRARFCYCSGYHCSDPPGLNHRLHADDPRVLWYLHTYLHPRFAGTGHFRCPVTLATHFWNGNTRLQPRTG